MSSAAIVTGAAGLVGAESVRFLAGQGLEVAGIDNDLRRQFYGDEGSVARSRELLSQNVRGYRHLPDDIRDRDAVDRLFRHYGGAIGLVIHAAAQPSHDWAAREPFTDFDVNAVGTLNLLEAMRRHCPEAVFVFTSTNKVYGDLVNHLPFVELESRWELDGAHPYYEFGVPETMSIDQTLHSLFGASKVAADVLVQEFGRYFGLRTACFRCGCLTGPGHAGVELHGFLAYLVKCTLARRRYRVLGYKGKQVRDNLHCSDLVNAFWHFFQEPRRGEVYNMGGGRASNCSVLEAIDECERLAGLSLAWSYVDSPRVGDHLWWISDVRKFRTHYPGWKPAYDIGRILGELVESQVGRDG